MDTVSLLINLKLQKDLHYTHSHLSSDIQQTNKQNNDTATFQYMDLLKKEVR